MTYKVHKFVSSVAVSSALCMGLLAPLQVNAQETQGNVEEMATAVDKASAGQPGSDNEVASTKAGSDFEAKLGSATVKIPQNPTGGVAVSRSSSNINSSFTVGISDGKLQAGQLAADGSVVYSGDNVGKTVQATQEGVRISTVIKSAEAATEYVHQLKLPDGAKAMRLSEYQLSAEDVQNAKAAADAVSKGSQGAATNTNTNAGADPIIIVDKESKLLGIFAEAWAKDANGKEISTSYEIRDGALVQRVDHKQQGVQYPVVADPYFGLDLTKSAEWKNTEDGWTLYVTPTLFARQSAFNTISAPDFTYRLGLLGWAEIREKYGDVGRGIKTNRAGMRNQWVCHQQFVGIVDSDKDTWNLDEWRPEVSYGATVRARCNP